MADVFITYAPADAELAVRIQKSLERAGISASRGPIQYTASWPARLLDDIDACVAVLALWSQAALRVDWVQTEAAIGAHFGQTVSVRTDPGLDRSEIPAIHREAPGAEIVDIFEGDLAPGGWGQTAAEMLDRKLGPVAGRIRALKARGPVAAPAAAAGAVPSGEEVQRRLSSGFIWVRRSGEAKGRSMPALAATRREAAFRSSFTALSGMDYPSDIRAGLLDFADSATARRGLARIYAEGLSRNDREFWGLVGRLAAPLSATLTLGGLQRSGAPAGVIADLIDPRDARDLHDERFGRIRSARAGGKGGVVMWPLAAVAVGLIALVAAPQIQRFAPSFDNTSFSLPSLPKSKAVAPANPEVAPAPWANGAETIRAAPLPPPVRASPPAEAAPVAAPPLSAQAPAPPAPAGVTEALNPDGSFVRLRYCRIAPDASETVLEVMDGERLFDVAGRAFMDSPEGIARIAERNAACLGPRALMLGDGRTIGGSDLIFAGDRLVIPVAKADSAGAAPPAAPGATRLR
ncbi:MAG: toll/interleukin-1 receptor domain-containing protein [Hyphomonadaceae bacterium]|nr:toll/interleukin-1 receptor domain-containing protein [Hyphomonadaceae bacterium]